MNTKTYLKHRIAMERLEAQEMLREMTVSSYPNMKSEAQSKLHSSISKKAFPSDKVYSFDEIEKALRL